MKKWMELFEDFQESGYKPADIQRIVMLYEMTREHDEMLKKILDEKNGRKTKSAVDFPNPELVSLKKVN